MRIDQAGGERVGAPTLPLPVPDPPATDSAWQAKLRPRVAALAVVVGTLLAAGPAGARVRVAIPEFQIEGGGSPALALQLQDGFVLGLVRAGVQVLDPVDTGRRLEGHPELQRCDSSPCLKAIGQLLDVKYAVRVRVEVAGNSYKTVARVFSTEGSAPAALPIATKSKSCDVCTVAEAREIMLRLADTLRAYLEEPAAPLAPPPPAAPPPPPSLAVPVVVAMVGAVAIAAGFAVLASNGSCTAAGCDENRARNVGGGVLIGAGAALTAMGSYVTVMRSRGGEPVTGVSVALRW
jgi:hypothetical protein